MQPNKKKEPAPLPSATQELHDAIRAAVDKVGHGPNDWAAVAALVPDCTAGECRRRWELFLDPSFSKAPLSPQEIRIMMEFQARNKGTCNWAELAQIVQPIEKRYALYYIYPPSGCLPRRVLLFLSWPGSCDICTSSVLTIVLALLLLCSLPKIFLLNDQILALPLPAMASQNCSHGQELFAAKGSEGQAN